MVKKNRHKVKKEIERGREGRTTTMATTHDETTNWSTNGHDRLYPFVSGGMHTKGLSY